ncbi:MAG: transposase, IS605 OrfB [Candidatus Carbobacillus altaicus]|uniref:Transposase, IS605 OrfB n=1 Tax=Candidatus Carbonibacillus altaicus TaxID=2163959 RepID=A0A2R6XX96_9BACL|nr:MAG: transposase, IS605 OrfB [Candidatus Carbobacillus altaicus]
MTKAERIKNSLQKTKERRKTQRPVVFEIKLQNLSRKKAETLKKAFLEAKWLYNWLVSDLDRLNLPANKVGTVEVKVEDAFEERQLVVLGSQIKQEIADRLKDNLRALAKLKQNGHKVGRLKPKKFVNSVPLKQYGVTYSLDFARNRVRIQKLGSFRVLGLHQIPPDAEIASAVLVGRPSGYYIHVTAYLSTTFANSSCKLGEDIGVDFGVDSKFTLSNGIKIDFELHETPRLKQLQRKLAKSEKGSKNRRKIRHLLRREYEKIKGRRKDAQNKILAFLKLYEKVVFQEDFVKGWAALFGKQVYSSGIGGLKARLRNSLVAPIPVDRFEPTSQECYACGKRHKLSLADRVIKCDCGWTCDRDVNAARVILRKGIGLSPDQAVGLDRPELKPPEKKAAARILGMSPYIRVSFLQ